MARGRLHVAVVVMAASIAATLPVDARRVATPGAHAVAADWRARGLDLGYNLDYPQALAAFHAAEAADPDDSIAPRLAAATIWMQILFDQGAVTVDDYLGDARATISRAPVPADKAGAFHTEIDRAIAMSEAALGRAPDSADAHFQAGAAYAVVASYMATVEGRVGGAFGPARRAYKEHERVLEIDPHRLDAGLVVGLYRCAISDLSFPMRLMARIAGFKPDREGGVKLIERAASAHADNEANAQFMRILLYSRAGRFDDALEVVGAMKTRYPRNRLLWLEESQAALAAGHVERAKAAVEAGLERLAVESRPLALGERARWQFAYGAALVAGHEVDAARTHFALALAGATRDWLRGRIHRERGKAADLAGDRPVALDEYRTAEQLCRADHDSDCVATLRPLAKTPYR
jgi:tetratricopeptide (TPR) repeat protein